jgi:glycyl-tRNA synthetase
MEQVYELNNFLFYDEEDIRLREQFTRSMPAQISTILTQLNSAWTFERIEAPSLIPRDLLSAEYSDNDIWAQPIRERETPLALKPETTPSTYAWMVKKLEARSRKLPWCVWQLSKSFRREQDQPSRHMRLKEFYQMEFQCLYAADSKCDYMREAMEPLAEWFSRELCVPTRAVQSDRLPAYSERTWDIEAWNADKWMEVCSVSLRKDFPIQPRVKDRAVECRVLEIACGPDRMAYCKRQSLLAVPALRPHMLLDMAVDALSQEAPIECSADLTLRT